MFDVATTSTYLSLAERIKLYCLDPLAKMFGYGYVVKDDQIRIHDVANWEWYQENCRIYPQDYQQATLAEIKGYDR